MFIEGDGQLEHNGNDYAVGKGDVMLLPAAAGPCLCRARGAVSLWEISLPHARRIEGKVRFIFG